MFPFTKYYEYWKRIWDDIINRISKRPNNTDLRKLSFWKSLFAIKFSNLLDNDVVIANIDEWSVNYQSGDSYSWWRKGTNKELRALPFKGSISIILWIFSNGAYFWSAIQRTVNSSVFCQFLKMVEDWTTKTRIFEGKMIITILDNWPSHRARATVKVMKKSTLNYLFLPSYSPQLAPVELSFNTFKKRLIRDWKRDLTNLRDIGAFDKVRAAISKFTSEEIKKYYSIFYEKVKFYLDNSIR